MLQKLSIAVFLALLLASAAAYAAAPIAVTTFACSGNKAQRVGPCPHGGEPSFLIQGSDGNFYGTTFVSSEGNLSQPNGGTVFSVAPNGQFTLLHTFLPGVKNNYPNGNNPGLITEGSDGNFYGVTSNGGVPGHGVLYRVSRKSGFKVIHQFCSARNCTDGYIAGSLLSTGTVPKTLKPFVINAAVGAPPSALLQVKNGTLWGTTTMFGKVSAGHFRDGVVYSLNAGLPPR